MSDNRSLDRTSLVFLIAIAAIAAIVAFVGALSSNVGSGETKPLEGQRVIVFTIPGVTWEDVRKANTPTLDRITAQGASAALAPRTAFVHPSSTRGYVTLGAGNRAGAADDSTAAQQQVFEMDEEVRAGVRASDLLDSAAGPHHRRGDLVHLGVAELQARQRSLYHGAVIGSLGEALARAHVARAIVSAGERSLEASPFDALRGAPVLTMVDRRGVVPRGVIRGLTQAQFGDPFSVRTARAAFRRAVQEQLEEARVLVVEPGETLRADAFAQRAFPDRIASLRKGALERADVLLGDVVKELEDDDLLIVVAPSSDSNIDQEHLTPIVAWGKSVEPGLLVSATTHRQGTVTLTDVAPTILGAVGVDAPASMSGRPIRFAPGEEIARPKAHDELDQRSVFRERFAPVVFYTFIALFVVLSLFVGLVFLAHLPFHTPLVGMCYLILAVPLVTFLLTVVPLWRLGAGPAHVVLWSLSIVVAGTGWLIGGRSAPGAWTGAVPLLLATASFVAVSLVMGANLLTNGVFGNSVLAAGRFYGISNTGSALFFGASLLAVAGIGEMLGQRWRTWMTAALVVVIVLTGLPWFGADVGGLLTGIAAVAMVVLVVRGDRVPWRQLAIALVAAAAATLFVAYLDSLRAPDQQTHLGRFAEELFGGGGVAFETIRRKATQSWASLSFSRFTYVIPLGIAALAVLLRRPAGPLRDVLPRYPLFRAGLSGMLVAGVLGFAVNDSGIAIPALLMGQTVPLVVLLGVEHMGPRRGTDD